MQPSSRSPGLPGTLREDNVRQLPHINRDLFLDRFLYSLPLLPSPSSSPHPSSSRLPSMGKDPKKKSAKKDPPAGKTKPARKNPSATKSTPAVKEKELTGPAASTRKKTKTKATPLPTPPPPVDSSSSSESDDGGRKEREQRREQKTEMRKRCQGEADRMSKAWGFRVPLQWVDAAGVILSPDEILDVQSKGWTSRVYTHFLRPTILGSGKDTKYVFVCKDHNDKVVRRKRSDRSTGNLLTHIRVCDPDSLKNQQDMETTTTSTNIAVGFRSTYTRARFRVALSQWVTSANRPISIVRDSGLFHLFTMLNSSVELPSRQSISRDIVKFHIVTRELVGKYLQDLNSSLTLGIDGWTAPTSLSWVAIVVHFALGNQMQKFLLDFVRVQGSHTGLHLANTIVPILNEFGIKDQVTSVVADGAPNNDTMCDHLAASLLHFSGRDSKVTCFAHVLNLIVGCLLKPFTNKRASKAKVKVKKPKAKSTAAATPPEDDDEDDDDLDSFEPEDIDELALHDLDKIAFEEEEAQALVLEVLKEMELEGEEKPIKITQAILDESRTLIPRLTLLATKMRYNGLVKTKFAGILSGTAFPDETLQTLPRPVATRWSSTGETIDAAVVLETPLRQLLATPGLPLKKATLTDTQWKMAVDLAPILDAFAALTAAVSKSNHPMVHEVLRWLDFIQKGLDRNRCLESNHPAVRFACVVAQRMLNKAYKNTDNTWVIRTAIILHPNYKTGYFKREDWPEAWQTDAVGVARKVWTNRYAPKPADKEKEEAERPKKPLPKGGKASRDDILMRFTGSTTTPLAPSTVDEFTSYINEAVIEEKILNVLDWWAVKARTHPRLARMARDVLSIPISSVDVERTFKRGRDTISYKRHSLGDDTVRASLAFGDWVKYPGLVPTALLDRLTDDNTKRAASRLTTDKAITAIREGCLDDLLGPASTPSSPALSVIDEGSSEEEGSDVDEQEQEEAGLDADDDDDENEVPE